MTDDLTNIISKAIYAECHGLSVSDAHNAALEVINAIEASGHVVVPMEPSEEMCAAAKLVQKECLEWSLEPGEGLDNVDFAPAYRAMILARPKVGE